MSDGVIKPQDGVDDGATGGGERDTTEELENYAKLIEGIAEEAIKYAVFEGEVHAIRGFDDLRRAAKKLRRPDPTPVPRL